MYDFRNSFCQIIQSLQLTVIGDLSAQHLSVNSKVLEAFCTLYKFIGETGEVQRVMCSSSILMLNAASYFRHSSRKSCSDQVLLCLWSGETSIDQL